MNAFAQITDLLHLAVSSIITDQDLTTGSFNMEISQVKDRRLDCTVDLQDYRVNIRMYGNTPWQVVGIYPMCPLCPDWDERYPLENDFFGEPCQINGQACCETCYNVYHLTHSSSENEEEPKDLQHLLDEYQGCSEPTQRFLVKVAWKALSREVREKGYSIYCGYHAGTYDGSSASLHDFAIIPVDGWPSVWTANYENVLRACFWLDAQGHAVNEDEHDEGCSCEECDRAHMDRILTNMEGWSEPEENDDPNLEPDFTDSPIGLCYEDCIQEVYEQE